MNADVKDATECVVDELGVFVDGANGDDDGLGTKTAPLKTITAALAKLAGKPRIFVCGPGPYTEHLRISSSVAIAAGYDCGSWRFTGDKAKIAPTDPGFALDISNAPSTSISDMAFVALPGNDQQRSSVAVFLATSTVRFSRVIASAGDGADGADATTGTNYDPSLTPDDVKIAGNSALGTDGGPPQLCTNLCGNGIHATGGKGGNGGNEPTAGEPGLPALDGGAGGMASVSCGAGGLGGGGDGASAPASAHATAAPTLGVLSEAGWTPADGPAGIAGAPGQGGGGGGGSSSKTTGAGGGGGCGGCGGAPGNAAQGGGASVALLSFQSHVTLLDVDLTSAKAGAGGNGADGQPGQIGGNGGNPSSGGCKGGKGGTGGAGAGGAGGISVAVLFKGSEPTTEGDVTLTPGTKGDKGIGGVPGINDGIDGTSAQSLEVP